jgi:peptidoglycan/LPS O-acetylase OafA/YrhL
MAQLLVLYAAPLWSWLEHPVTRYLGTISYPMYLYHQWGDSVGRHAAPANGPAFVIGLLATILLATGSYYVIERPFLTLKRRFGVSRQARPSLSASIGGPAV